MSQYKILIITYCTCFDSIAIACLSFPPPSRPEVTSSPLDPRGSSNGSAVVRQPHAGGTSTSHCNTKTGTLSESKSSLGSHSHDKKGSVKSSVISGASKGPSGVYSGPLAAVQSSVNLHCHGQRLAERHPGAQEGLIAGRPQAGPKCPGYNGNNVKAFYIECVGWSSDNPSTVSNMYDHSTFFPIHWTSSFCFGQFSVL